ncbi:MAG: archease [Nannocystaceae bacterium]|jgi:SHS2 domain-containing protein
MSAGHRAIEHTADVAFALWADDLPALLLEGARALVELLTEGDSATTPPSAVLGRAVSIDAIDDEDRLVRWLNEVAWWAADEGFLVADATLQPTPEGLRGEARGELAPGRVVAEIKSATYHGLQITRDDDGRLHATVCLDV